METLIIVAGSASAVVLPALLLELISIKLRANKPPRHPGGGDPRETGRDRVAKTHDFLI